MKRIALLIVTLLVSMNFYAQLWDNSKPDQRFTFGVRAGANLSTLTEFDVDSKWGFHGGLAVDYNIVKSFAVETGLFYTVKSFELNSFLYSFYNDYYYYYDYYDVQEKCKLGYLQIPILAKLRLPVSDDVHVQVKGGGYFAYLINESSSYEISDRLKKPDMGVIFGAGVSYKKVYLGLQYEIGLYNVVSSEKIGDGRKRNLAISVGYDF